MNTTTRKTWRRVGMAGAMTLLLGTAGMAHAFENNINNTGVPRSHHGIQERARNLANVINHGKILAAQGEEV